MDYIILRTFRADNINRGRNEIVSVPLGSPTWRNLEKLLELRYVKECSEEVKPYRKFNRAWLTKEDADRHFITEWLEAENSYLVAVKDWLLEEARYKLTELEGVPA